MNRILYDRHGTKRAWKVDMRRRIRKLDQFLHSPDSPFVGCAYLPPETRKKVEHVRLLALDLSLIAPGWALSDGGSGVIYVPKVTGPERLRYLKEEVLMLCQSRQFEAGGQAGMEDAPCVDLVGIEGYAFSAHSSSVTKLAELGGVVRVALYEAGIPYVEIPSASMKKYATGKGNAKKDDVLLAAVRRLGYEGNSKDEADALWLLEMMMDYYGGRRRVPESHRAALKKIKWPVLAGGLL